MKKKYYKYIVTLFLTAFFAILLPAAYADSPKINALKVAAESGDAESQYNLAVAYDSGDGVDINNETAVYWYQKAADQSNVDAMFNLAVSYDVGEGVEQDKNMAFYWYKKTAQAGDPDGQNNLAVMYEGGEGIETNYQKALVWYTKAAIQANSLAQYNLAVLYLNGHGLPKADNVQAYAWFSVAAKNNESEASTRSYEIWSKLSKDERDTATQLAEQYINLYTAG